MALTLNDDDCYELFLSLDTLARIQGGANELVNSQRERFLPFYHDWHTAHPYEVHPTSSDVLRRLLSALIADRQ